MTNATDRGTPLTLREAAKLLTGEDMSAHDAGPVLRLVVLDEEQAQPLADDLAPE